MKCALKLSNNRVTFGSENHAMCKSMRRASKRTSFLFMLHIRTHLHLFYGMEKASNFLSDLLHVARTKFAEAHQSKSIRLNF